MVELQHYIEVVDMVHMAIKWRQGTSKKQLSSRAKDKMVLANFNKPIGDSSKGKAEAFPNRTRDIKCFKYLGRGHIASQCPN
ncbi:Retrovirus-related Pol polyprotein from transposon 17.6 [Gossypium australe]|uniref:Retrovirus-related Pol polyprotein from transposon 17.6 n=1 Tax=Gossypium australe TaxID=47621 RepID=A0A5B6VNL2_9ROSI|nr:Retrovirus-related Pol polyprotein from transposon 17.6 [Gossypium australe]